LSSLGVTRSASARATLLFVVYSRSHPMPRRYWFFGFWIFVSVPCLAVVFFFSVVSARSLSALADLPITTRLVERGLGGTVFHGSLAGGTGSTPLGEEAVAWIGVVEESHRSGKDTVTSRKCELASLDGLELVTPDGRAPIVAPDPSRIDPELGLWHGPPIQPIWWLGPRTEWSPLPPAVVERCRLNREQLDVGTWTYIEHRATMGAEVEIAGCVREGAIGRCPSGPATGTLAVGGLRPMILQLADSMMATVSFVASLFSALTVVAGVTALRAIRRAARASGGVL
jgi:hypothetical protein